LPLAATYEQSFVWILIPIILLLPNYLLADCMYYVVRRIAVEEIGMVLWNLTHVIWRQSQLYACSFPIAVMAFYEGTTTAFRAATKFTDNTKWVSFAGAWAAFTPMNMTGYWATFVLIFNIVCVVVSCVYVNRKSIIRILVTLFVCSINILGVGEIAYNLTVGLCLRNICGEKEKKQTSGEGKKERKLFSRLPIWWVFRLDRVCVLLAVVLLIIRIARTGKDNNLKTISKLLGNAFKKLGGG
jgi:hypothetical protein